MTYIIDGSFVIKSLFNLVSSYYMVINSQLVVSTPQALPLLSNSRDLSVLICWPFIVHCTLNYGINQRLRRTKFTLITILLYLCLYVSLARAGGWCVKVFWPTCQPIEKRIKVDLNISMLVFPHGALI